MLSFNELLELTLDSGASDLHLTVGVPPIMRINGKL
ncbi:MAG: type IV pili twitching motility protein PilT, partial [Clostridiales bacterium]|nr:type IV pili twitching motility protein PilT [Clostridiales bacterium]